MSLSNTVLEKGYDLFRDTRLEKLLNNPACSRVLESLMSFEAHTISYEGHTFEMYVPAGYNDVDQDPYFPSSAHEPASTHAFIENVEADDVVWDMGSIIGYFSVLAANLNENPSNVHIFESSTLKCWLVEQQNEELFDGQLNVVKAWLSDTDADGLTPDTYAKATEPPDFVKVDIEGAEVPVLRGMQDTIKAYQPTLLVEVHPNKIRFGYGSSDEHLLRWLTEHYEIKACKKFRDQQFEWTDDWEPLVKGIHDIRWNDARVTGHEERLSNPMGWIDWDSYQILCQPK